RIVPFLVREAPLPIVPAAWGDGLRRTESLIERYRSALPAILRVVSPAKAGPPSTIPAHLPSRFLTSQTRFHALSPCPPLQTWQNAYPRPRTPCIIPPPPPAPPRRGKNRNYLCKLSVELVCPKVCLPDRIADTLSATGCNIKGGRDPAPLLALG